MKRRETILAILGILLGGVIPTWQSQVPVFSGFRRAVRVRLETIFPATLSEQQWEVEQSQFIHGDMIALMHGLIHRGDLIDHKYTFNGTSAVWDLQFKNRMAVVRWQQEVSRLKLVSDADIRKLGYKLRTIIT